MSLMQTIAGSSLAAMEIALPAGAARRVQFPGLIAHARSLGVHRIHLWQVLSGRRESRRLLQRYRALKKKEAAS